MLGTLAAEARYHRESTDQERSRLNFSERLKRLHALSCEHGRSASLFGDANVEREEILLLLIASGVVKPATFISHDLDMNKQSAKDSGVQPQGPWS